MSPKIVMPLPNLRQYDKPIMEPIVSYVTFLVSRGELPQLFVLAYSLKA
jgi:hypothetical protein